MVERSAVVSSEIAVQSDYGRIEAVPSRGYSSVVGRPLHKGHASSFFIRKVQEMLFLKRKKKVAPYREFAVPKKNFTVIVDRQQWREMRAMRIYADITFFRSQHGCRSSFVPEVF